MKFSKSWMIAAAFVAMTGAAQASPVIASVELSAPNLTIGFSFDDDGYVASGLGETVTTSITSINPNPYLVGGNFPLTADDFTLKFSRAVGSSALFEFIELYYSGSITGTECPIQGATNCLSSASGSGSLVGSLIITDQNDVGFGLAFSETSASSSSGIDPSTGESFGKGGGDTVAFMALPSGVVITVSEPNNVPEPNTVALVALGLLGAGFARHRKTRSAANR